MSHMQIGPIEILFGENGSRAPYSTSLLLKGREADAMIDCGGGQRVFDYVKRERNIADIILTHYHLDHRWGAGLFPDANIWINPLDAAKLADQAELFRAAGYYAMFDHKQAERIWDEEQRYEAQKLAKDREADSKAYLQQPPVTADRTYPYDQEVEIVGTRAVMLHTPGHVEGFCCPYFPDYGVMLVGDFDLSSFGPWYFGADSHIDSFVASARRTLEVDAATYVTSHHKGVVSRVEYRKGLEVYLAIIDRREEQIRQAVRRGVSPEQMVYQSLLFRQEHVQNIPLLTFYEKLGIAKHLERLLAHGEPFHDYYQCFLRAHAMRAEFLAYSGRAVDYTGHG